jgi:hypothetical protein
MVVSVGDGVGVGDGEDASVGRSGSIGLAGVAAVIGVAPASVGAIGSGADEHAVNTISPIEHHRARVKEVMQ